MTTKNNHTDRFTLVDVLDQLRVDIHAAVDSSKNKQRHFDVEAVEVELVTVVEEAEGGGLNIGVLKFGSEYDTKRADIQKIKLKLTPTNTKTESKERVDQQGSGKARRISGK